jgi:uncharacterized protein YceK
MKRMLLVVAMIALTSSGCSMFRSKTVTRPVAGAVARPAPPQLVDANGAPIEKVPFVAGISSATVEILAKAQACRGGEGAALVTPAGPVEVYRMQCEDGRVFMARCEMRQCKELPRAGGGL